MKLSVPVEISYTENTFDIDLEDLGISEVEWLSFDDEKKEEILNDYINDHRELPSWVINVNKIELL